MPITYAAMSIHDYEQVIALWRRSPGVHVGASDDRASIRAYLRRNRGLSQVARRRRRIVGAMLCGHDGRRGFLHHLAVAEECRGRGIGRRLVRRCLKGLKAAGIVRCWIFVLGSNADGLKFWKATGWRQADDLALLSKDL